MSHSHSHGCFRAHEERGVTKDMPGLEHIHTIRSISIHHIAGGVVIETAYRELRPCHHEVGKMILGSHGRIP